jgi:hypothetical protein
MIKPIGKKKKNNSNKEFFLQSDADKSKPHKPKLVSQHTLSRIN